MECSSSITDSINTRIFARNIPTQMVQPYLSVRPAMTKYTFLPIVEPQIPSNKESTSFPTYKTSHTFFPSTCKPHFSGYATHVNHESELRNQIYALQRCDQREYVPDSSSDLYQYRHMNKSQTDEQPFPLLFASEQLACSQNNIQSDAQLFNNTTR